MAPVIVGHGPSLLQRAIGEDIDKHDFVIRLKRCAPTLSLPANYGTRTDAVCGSYTIRHGLKEVDAPEYWVFLDSRHIGVQPDPDEPYVFQKALCDEWNELYRGMRTEFELSPQTERKATSDDFGHTHMSAGLHAILYACELLQPERLDLAGFDNIQSGSFTWSITRGPEWNRYPDHRWDIERRMIPLIEDNFGVEIRHL